MQDADERGGGARLMDVFFFRCSNAIARPPVVVAVVVALFSMDA